MGAALHEGCLLPSGLARCAAGIRKRNDALPASPHALGGLFTGHVESASCHLGWTIKAPQNCLAILSQIGEEKSTSVTLCFLTLYSNSWEISYGLILGTCMK